ncbi:hypothetical protein AC1031_002470, partial [Aphanomyces cochlioides]
TLETDGQEWVLHQEAKLVVELITKAVQPSALQKAVEKQMQLTRNKPLRSDVVRFLKWLQQYATGYQMYGSLEEEKPAKHKADDAKRGKPHGQKDHKGEAATGAKGHGSAKEQGAVEQKKPSMACLKGGSNSHRVHEHPGITEEEAMRLLEQWEQNRRKQVKVVKAAGQEQAVNDKDKTTIEYGATVEGVLTLPTVLLDSGSDESLATKGLVVELERLGVKPDLVDKNAIDMKPYEAESKPLRVHR